MKNRILILLCIGISLTGMVRAQTIENFEFDTINWDFPGNYQITGYQGKQALLIERASNDSSKGYYATVKKFNFKDGVIEFDMFCPQQDSSFVGFLFRLTNHKEEDRYELFYFNPYMANDTGAVQYMPVNNGTINWPDYDHNAYQSDGDIPQNEWIHVKAEINGLLATVSVNDQVVMTIPDLARGRTVGKVGLWLGNTSECYYSGFKMTVDSVISGYSKDGKRVYASSVENDGVLEGYAFDKIQSTRWSTPWRDPQWIMIDLGEIQKVGGVILRWETAYAKAYEIRVSQDSSEWTTVYSTTTGNGNTDQITFDQVDTRYVMMYGTQRGTQWGYSLYEFEVYDTLEIPSSIHPYNSITKNSVTIYPNPASDIIIIETSCPVNYIEVYDVSGNKTKTYTNRYHSKTVSLDITDLPKGLYLLRIQTENKTITQKLLIK